MTNFYINRIISDEIDKINLSDSEKKLIYQLLEIEKRLLNTGQTKFKKDYRRAVEKIAGDEYP